MGGAAIRTTMQMRDVVKTLNVEADYPMAYENFEDADAHIPHVIDDLHNRRRLHSCSAA